MALKIIKYISSIIVVSSIALVTTIFISSLSSYTEKDFNIPSDFFKTRHYDKDANSKDNGFQNYISFIELLNKYDNTAFIFFSEKGKNLLNNPSVNNSSIDTIIELYNKKILNTIKNENKFTIKNDITLTELDYFIDNYIWLKNKKSFNKKLQYEIGKHYFKIHPDIKINSEKNKDYLKLLENRIEHKNDEILINNILDDYEKKTYRQLENFVRLNSLKFKKMSKHDFFKIQEKYTGINSEIINQHKFIQYIRSSHYVIYNYLEKGEHEIAIEILRNNQLFLDSIIKKGDINLMLSLSMIFLSEINIKMFEYILNDYLISTELKDIIEITIRNKYDNSFIINAIKNEYLDSFIKCIGTYKNHCENIFILTTSNFKNNYVDGTETMYERIKNKFYQMKINIILHLFYSNTEEKLLLQKYYYEIITNGDQSTFSIDLNINNYIGRKYLPKIKDSILLPALQKEEKLENLRNKILQQLKTD